MSSDEEPHALWSQLPGVSDPLVRALIAAGIVQLTPVQVACLPHCLAGGDVLAKAKTGTGKTLAFLIPTIQRLLQSARVPLEEVDPVRAIVLSSTRELAAQIVAQAKMLTSCLPECFNVESILGGSSITPQRERLDKDSIPSGEFRYGGIVDLMIATPGRLMEHIESTPGFEFRLLGLQTLILDEVDQLLDGGFQRNIESIIVKLPRERQSLCFSATVPERLARVLGMALQEGHCIVDCVGEEVDTHASIEQLYKVHSLEESMLALYSSACQDIERSPEDYKILAFLPTARQTQFSTAVLRSMGLNVMEIHSRMKQNERTSASDAFRAGNKMILLSSDVSARGVDYPDVTLVLQVGAPSTREVYVQRLGRTGRAGKAGTGLLLLCDFERHFLQQLKDLPIREWTVQHASSSELPRVQEVSKLIDDDLASQTYRAWLMANVGMRKLFKWTKQEMVDNANLYARAVLGRDDTPPLNRDLVIQLGLQGLTGINAVDSLPEDAEPNAPSEEKLVVKVNRFEFNFGLRNDAKAAFDAIQSLSQADMLALQAAFLASSEAEVAGFKIQASWLTFSSGSTKTSGKEEKTVSSSGAASSLVARMTFPSGGAVEGVKSTTRPVLELKKLTMGCCGASDSKDLAVGITGSLTLSSRVAICGSSTSGCSMLMAILCSHPSGSDYSGELVRQCNLRVAYLVRDWAQSLAQSLELSMMSYIAKRFQKGYDEELQRQFLQLEDGEAARRTSLAEVLGKDGHEVAELLSRKVQGNAVLYEVRWLGLDDPAQNTFESITKLRKMGLQKLILACDERTLAKLSGLDQRPLNRREIVRHCEAFGLNAEQSCAQLASLGASERLRAALAATFWTKPHIVALEEATHGLEPEMVEVLAEALQGFRGGVLLVDSNRVFIEKVCSQTWTLEDSQLIVAPVVKSGN